MILPAQICASYRFRRDLVEAAKVPGMLGRARLVTQDESLARVSLSNHLQYVFQGKG